MKAIREGHWIFLLERYRKIGSVVKVGVGGMGCTGNQKTKSITQ